MNRTYILYAVISLSTFLFACDQNRTRANSSGSSNHNIEIPTNAKINLYIENSGSMDGYVNGQTSFESDLYKLVTKLKGKYNSISTSVIFSKGSRKLNNELEITKFEPANLPFRDQKKETSGTAIDQILKSAINKTSAGSISILVSDFIYSNNSINPITPGITITNIVQDQLKRDPDFSILFVKQVSNFKGTYFSESNKNKYFINAPRPYYLCFLGSDLLIREIFSYLYPSKPIEFFYISNVKATVYSQLLLTPKIGNYRLDKKSPKASLIDAESQAVNGKRIFQFSLGVDFSQLSQNDAYFLDPTNYTINGNYNIEIIKKPNNSLAKITHFLYLKTTQLKDEIVHIELRKEIPAWVSECSTDQDSNITKANQSGKTYGFKHLVQGAFDGYLNLTNQPYCKFDISIKR